MVWFFANAKTNKFFKKVITLNILLLWKSKIVIALIIRVINHKKRHFIIEIYHNVLFIMKLFLNKEIFIEKLGLKFENKLKTFNITLFCNRISVFANKFFFKNYICWANEN